MKPAVNRVIGEPLTAGRWFRREQQISVALAAVFRLRRLNVPERRQNPLPDDSDLIPLGQTAIIFGN